jgi:hypothetical protein
VNLLKAEQLRKNLAMPVAARQPQVIADELVNKKEQREICRRGGSRSPGGATLCGWVSYGHDDYVRLTGRALRSSTLEEERMLVAGFFSC